MSSLCHLLNVIHLWNRCVKQGFRICKLNHMLHTRGRHAGDVQILWESTLVESSTLSLYRPGCSVAFFKGRKCFKLPTSSKSKTSFERIRLQHIRHQCRIVLSGPDCYTKCQCYGCPAIFGNSVGNHTYLKSAILFPATMHIVSIAGCVARRNPTALWSGETCLLLT